MSIFQQKYSYFGEIAVISSYNFLHDGECTIEILTMLRQSCMVEPLLHLT